MKNPAETDYLSSVREVPNKLVVEWISVPCFEFLIRVPWQAGLSPNIAVTANLHGSPLAFNL